MYYAYYLGDGAPASGQDLESAAKQLKVVVEQPPMSHRIFETALATIASSLVLFWLIGKRR